MNYPYPIKDWREESQYPQACELTIDQWAWEFTRRNAEFQRHWDIFRALPDHSPEVGIKNGKWKGNPILDRPMSEYLGIVEPLPMDGETYREYLARNRDIDCLVLSYCDFFYSKFGTFPCDPKEDDYSKVIQNVQLSERYVERPTELSLLNVSAGSFEANLVVQQIESINECYDLPRCFVFDFSRPLEFQLEEIRAAYKTDAESSEYFGQPTKRKIDSKRSADLFPKCIRVLDAYAELGVSSRPSKAQSRIVAEVLMPHEPMGKALGYSAEKKLERWLDLGRDYSFYLDRSPVDGIKVNQGAEVPAIG
jgi:hypothetical protein